MEVGFTLRQLEYFVAAAEHGSLSAAAAVCHVSTAALAQAVTELERSVGAQLLVRRRSKGVGLTAAGVAFLADARPLLRQAGDVQARVAERQHGLVGPLALGCYTTLVPFWVPAITADFIRPHPRLEMTVEEGDAAVLQQRMIEGYLDAVLTHRRHLVPGVEAHTVKPGRPYVLLPAAHPLAAMPAVTLEELRDLDYIQLDVPSVRDNQLANLRASGLDPHVRWRSSSFEAVRGMVGRGLGYTVLVQRSPVDLTYDGLPVRAVEIDGEIGHSDICIATTSDQRPSFRLQALIDFCVRVGEDPPAPEGAGGSSLRTPSS
ncbi:LysR substrate-binding domain-containing protein [Microbacterium hominis]|uniref:LysR family transcriptional regulator n=1 Tax=Microbacterium hominis TaxID=162426 RepID=A0A7D4PN93_9MICO|nr:LysR substrate-binding domain-containing protein [Microbacterium hominis]QKJ20115.1 LysR family transcriptional regulator [Microbacterium hominis]